MTRTRLPAVVFVCGAIVMAFELVGSRVLAPTVGSSLFVWTSLIGIILASLSFGYWYGGRFADRHPQRTTLAAVIWAASCGVFLTAFFHIPVLEALSLLRWDQRLVATLAGLILFAPASIMLGMVSPFAARLAMRDVTSSGSTVGSLYAASTVGSIAGTFLTGWVLIGYFGTTTVLYLLALLALATSFAAEHRSRITARIITALAIIACMAAWRMISVSLNTRGFVDVDTRYQRAQILKGYSVENGRPVRYLRTDPLGAQSAVYLDGGTDLVARYTRVFDSIASGREVRRALTIGGGAQVWPSQFAAERPGAVMDVVEIDPGLIGLARDYFGFHNLPGLSVIHEDGRAFLNRTHEPYDLIFMDAFSGTAIPVQLTTRESIERLDAALAPGGLVVANLIGIADGPDASLVRAIVATYRSVFPYVTVLPLGDDPRSLQNIVVVSARHPVEALQELSYVPVEFDTAGVAVLTDEYAPVERLGAPLYR